MKNIYLISDTHFGQKFAVKFSHRPFQNLIEMDKALMTNWNENVGKDDIVIILGDFFAGSKFFSNFLLKNLNGEKILVKGNHDFRFRYKKLLDTRRIKIYKKMEFSLLDHNFILTHKPMKNMPDEAFNIHGHHHRKLLPSRLEQSKYFNVAVDHINYKPISIREVIEDRLGIKNIDLMDIIEQIKYSNTNKKYALAKSHR